MIPGCNNQYLFSDPRKNNQFENDDQYRHKEHDQ